MLCPSGDASDDDVDVGKTSNGFSKKPGGEFIDLYVTLVCIESDSFKTHLSMQTIWTTLKDAFR